MENFIKINNNIVKTSNTDENLYNHLGLNTSIGEGKFSDEKTVENYITDLIEVLDAFNGLVEYEIDIENCVIKDFEINTSEELSETLWDNLDILKEKYNCDFDYDCSAFSPGSAYSVN